MNLKATTKKEFYPNGNLKYTETIATVDPLFYPLFPNRRGDKNNEDWIRIGKNQKFRENGKLEWEIIYDEFGNISNKSNYESKI